MLCCGGGPTALAEVDGIGLATVVVSAPAAAAAADTSAGACVQASAISTVVAAAAAAAAAAVSFTVVSLVGVTFGVVAPAFDGDGVAVVVAFLVAVVANCLRALPSSSLSPPPSSSSLATATKASR